MKSRVTASSDIQKWPILRRRKYNPHSGSVTSFDQTFVVLFTSETDGFVVHAESRSSRQIGYGGKSVWSSFSDTEVWETLKSTEQVILSND